MKKGDLVEFSTPVVEGGIGIVMENSITGVRVCWLTGGMAGTTAEYTLSRILKNLT